MKNKEDNLQTACVRWFRYQYPDEVIFSIPNGGTRNIIEAAKLKRTGTLAGVADLFIMKSKWYSNVCLSHGLFIELKCDRNKQTDRQKEFEGKATITGYDYAVCRTVDEFIETINIYMI